MQDSAQMAAYFAMVSRDLLAGPDEELTFQRIAERAVDVIPACDFVGITLRRRRGRPDSVALTSPIAEDCDNWQYELDEGPCLDAISEDEAYLIDDVANDPRWPRWGPKAAKAGAGSILSIRMADDSKTLGALNLYSKAAHAFDTDSVDVALVFASHAATAISATQLVSGLQTALQSRHLIGVAQGVLMARYDMSMETSFEVLRRYSSNANIKLRELAQQVADAKSLPHDYTDVVRLDAQPPRPPLSLSDD